MMVEEVMQRQELALEHGAERRHEHGHEHAHEHDGQCCCTCCDDDDDELEVHQLAVAPTFSYRVLDVDCPHCALTCQNAVRMLESVDDAQLIYATATLNIVKKRGVADDDCLREVLETVRSCGQDLDLTPEELARLSAERSWLSLHREQILMGISGATLAAGLIIDHAFGNEQTAIPFYAIAALAGLIFVTPMAIATLKRRTADMNVLMAIAVLGGLIMGFSGDTSTFGDAAIVIFLAQVGEWLEGWSMRKTSGSIQNLAKLAPDTAHLVQGERTSDVSVSAIQEGQRIRILPGERVPLDGIILSGGTSLNEAPVTGESVPQDKGAGDEVYAGTLNTAGVIDIEVTADEDCTTLARIIAMVQGAQAEKAPYESFIDRFAEVYTPIVVCVAVVVGIGVPLALSALVGFSPVLWHDWIYRALSLLVVACPCALVISTPVSFVSAITRAANTGVLVKGGAFFDIASKVTAVAFDKTGTLTSGKPEVVGIACADGADAAEVLALAHALEENSTHPLAQAVVAHARENAMEKKSADSVREVASAGMMGAVAGASCLIGKPAFAREHVKLPGAVEAAIEAFAAQGASALVVGRNGMALGVIGVADTLRPRTSETMRAFAGTANVRRLEMLTGDNGRAAAAVAAEAGDIEYAAELLPDGKLARIRSLQSAGEKVAMVGDGINDAPALAAANLAITMGAAASDTALAVADVALLSDDISQLPAFFRLSERTMHIVQENIVFAILVKALVFVLVIAGVAGMSAAVFADTGVALIVILNGMRLMTGWDTRW